MLDPMATAMIFAPSGGLYDGQGDGVAAQLGPGRADGEIGRGPVPVKAAADRAVEGRAAHETGVMT